MASVARTSKDKPSKARKPCGFSFQSRRNQITQAEIVCVCVPHKLATAAAAAAAEVATAAVVR